MLALLVASAAGHGQIVIPPARNNGSVELAGDCGNYACFWFSQLVNIPGKPTLPDAARTFNVDINSGPNDWSATFPWRAPGTAPVYGSGCGVAGGGPVPMDNGGMPPPGFNQGDDFLTISEQPATVWKRGSVQEVGWATFANHGGGYSWRLCPKDSNITEECFLANTLEFDGPTQWIRYQPFFQWDTLKVVPDIAIPAMRVTEGTYPTGSMWTRNPIPGCNFCNQADCMKLTAWIDQQHCSQACSGVNVTGRACPAGTEQFPPPGSGLSGYYADVCLSGDYDKPVCDGLAGFQYSIIDHVKVPLLIKTGKYLLSWRWDCEQSQQIWQNCADLIIE